MRAATYAEFGGPEVLKVVDDVPEPHAGPGQVRIEVRAAGVNQADWKFREGLMGGDPPSEPRIPGSEAAGVVDEVGEGVEGVSAGDAVFGSTGAVGAQAEYAVLAQWASKPDAVSFEEAAGWPVAAETAARGLDLLGLEPGMTLLVNGGSGGVGQAVIQLARHRGALVVATASEGNFAVLEDLGAAATTYGEGLAERVVLLAPEGVDRAYDVAGHGALPALIEIAGGADNVITIADFENAPALGVRATGESSAWHVLAELAALSADGRFTLPVERTFSFGEVAEAQRVSQEGHARGKFVLVPQALTCGR